MLLKSPFTNLFWEVIVAWDDEILHMCHDSSLKLSSHFWVIESFILRHIFNHKDMKTTFTFSQNFLLASSSPYNSFFNFHNIPSFLWTFGGTTKTSLSSFFAPIKAVLVSIEANSKSLFTIIAIKIFKLSIATVGEPHFVNHQLNVELFFGFMESQN